MPLSRTLAELAVRAKAAEDAAAEARKETESTLEARVDRARSDVQSRSEDLRRKADAMDRDSSAWWAGLQTKWAEGAARMRADMGARKAAIDSGVSELRAEQAEADADMAVAFAIAAIEQAEYAVLDATLARTEARAKANAG